MVKQELIIKQGYSKSTPWLKLTILDNMQIDWLSKEIFDLELSEETHYGHKELNAFFYQAFAENCSGSMGVKLATKKYDFNLMDQQTVSERFDDYIFKPRKIERMLNQSILDQVKQLPSYRSDLNLKKVKKQETQRRRRLARQRPSWRIRQRERGVEPPEGRYLAMDFTLKPNYMDIEEYRDQQDPMAYVMTKDRRKKSTNTFTGYHTVYDTEAGSRQVLGYHMLRNEFKPGYKAGWKREGLDEAVKFLLDPIFSQISVEGIVGDGDYRNMKVMRYLQSHEKDYVVLENMTDRVKQIIEDKNLEKELDFGEGYEVKGGMELGRGKKAVKNRLVIVNRGGELIPLLLAPYSSLTPEQALLLYEERFGIETGYREVYKYLPNTTSRSPLYRSVLYGMTCWFFNLLLNYYQIVVVYSADPPSLEVSLIFIKKQADQLFAALLSKLAKQ